MSIVAQESVATIRETNAQFGFSLPFPPGPFTVEAEEGIERFLIRLSVHATNRHKGLRCAAGEHGLCFFVDQTNDADTPYDQFADAIRSFLCNELQLDVPLSITEQCEVYLPTMTEQIRQRCEEVFIGQRLMSTFPRLGQAVEVLRGYERSRKEKLMERQRKILPQLLEWIVENWSEIRKRCALYDQVLRYCDARKEEENLYCWLRDLRENWWEKFQKRPEDIACVWTIPDKKVTSSATPE